MKKNEMTLEEFITSGVANTDLFEQMFAQYQADPEQVNSAWREQFALLEKTEEKRKGKQEDSKSPIPVEIASKPSIQKDISDPSPQSNHRLEKFIEAYRRYGHLLAHVNPLADQSSVDMPELSLENYGFTEKDLSSLFPTFGLLEKPEALLGEIVEVLKKIYCNKIGYEFLGMQNKEVEEWIQGQIESMHNKPQLSIQQKQQILQLLNKSELFESFLNVKYTGQKRFSLEGAETLIPMMFMIVETGANLGIEDFVVGMAHRGRLNVLCNIMNKSYKELFAEFDENYIPETFEGSGDVKYHKGYSSEILTSQGHRIQISITANPSHLESVDAVVEGQVRAKQELRKDNQLREQVLPLLLHGDGALSGQGVVYETWQLNQLPGYTTGGTIHLVINNQISFTTLPSDARSTPYCTDLAKAFGSPVFHVNAEDPDGCIFATNLAVEFRQKFHTDVVIDLNGYRKYGHNESDEPAFTQPLEYQIIRKKKSIRDLYREELIGQGIIEKYLAEELESNFKKALQEALKGSQASLENQKKTEVSQTLQPDNDKIFMSVSTAVNLQSLQAMAERFCAIPRDFTIHPKLENLQKERLAMLNNPSKSVDWGMGETLAYASLLWEGTPVRITGQDCCRGTFSHRHALWVDQKTDKQYFPLAHLKKDQGIFEIYNSPLSEFAALGFELGFSFSYPEALVVWEAQFGDFANGAQVIIDQYLAGSEQKWGRKSGLVLLLPHGYEGQGPEHSSARMERFLALAANQNMLVVNPTTPAQFFHLIRRQIIGNMLKPLVVFTPKGLLRHPACLSTTQEFTEGGFSEVIDDPNRPALCKRLAFCSGRIYYDLSAERFKVKSQDLALIRIEQLYPLNLEKIKVILSSYVKAEEFFWIQEEPRNMGPWSYIHEILGKLIPNNKTLHYIGRPASASPAVGSHALHKKEHANIMNSVFPQNKEPFLEINSLQRV